LGHLLQGKVENFTLTVGVVEPKMVVY
jgi:hypothetical protein